jgi:hypothetical protein
MKFRVIILAIILSLIIDSCCGNSGSASAMDNDSCCGGSDSGSAMEKGNYLIIINTMQQYYFFLSPRI